MYLSCAVIKHCSYYNSVNKSSRNVAVIVLFALPLHKVRLRLGKIFKQSLTFCTHLALPLHKVRLRLGKIFKQGLTFCTHLALPLQKVRPRFGKIFKQSLTFCTHLALPCHTRTSLQDYSKLLLSTTTLLFEKNNFGQRAYTMQQAQGKDIETTAGCSQCSIYF